MRTEAVLDTSALVARALGESGADKVEAWLERGGCVMHIVNVSEACFTLSRKRPDLFNRHSARGWLLGRGINFVFGFDSFLADQVAEIRLGNMALNIGDGVAVALAGVLGVPLLVADRGFRKSAAHAALEIVL